MAKAVAFSLAEMKALWKSNKVYRNSGRHDRIEKNRGGISYYLFGNEIAFYDPNNDTLTLSDARHRTNTTKDRLNGLGAGIMSRDDVWYINVDGKRTVWPGKIKFRV